MPALTRNCRPLLQTAGGKRHASSDDTEDVGAVRSAAAAAPTKAFSRPKLLHEVSPIGKQRIEAAAAQKRASEIVEIEDSPSPRKRPRNATNNKTEAEKTLPSPSSLNSVQTKTPGERNTEKSKEKGKPAKRGKVMDVDLDADPIDSDDLEEVTAKEKQNQQGNTKGPSTEGDPEFKTLNVQPKTRTPAKKTFKRLAPMVSDDELDGSDEEIFPQASRPNPKKKGVRVPKPSGKGTQNLHAPRSSQTKPIVYGKKDKLKREREKEAEEKRQKKAQLAAEKKKQAEPPEFKKISIPTSSQFSANSGEFTRDASPPLSDIPDEDEDDVAMVGLDGQVKIDCPRCGESIAQSLKEDFEDEILKDRRMNFAWQGRFCGYHRKRTAKDQWQLRGYPAIDFSALGRRMGKYDAVLRRILNDERSSHHRQQLKARSKQSKKHQQESVEEGTSRTIMGYYGPKGEKIMLDWIIKRFSDDIRRRATHDPLISSKGMSGGVTGFVQAVLAPHLAELLVKEDMGLESGTWEHAARGIIAESAELGELLHPEEAEDRVGEDSYQRNTFGRHALEDEEDEEEHADRKEPETIELDA